MLIGYARVSTDEQHIDLQRNALREVGCERIFEDKVSGIVRARPGLDAALAALGAGDVLTVWKLDRLGRSLQHLVEVVAALGERGVGFRSLTESIDTSSAGGKLVFHIFASMAEFERALIVERTHAGLAAAKARGVRLGRKNALTRTQIEHAKVLVAAGTSPTVVARTLKVGRSTLYRGLSGS